MKGRLIDFSIGYNRKQRITIELDSDFRVGFDALKDVDVEIGIKKWRAKRSKDANAYFHLLVNEIAAAIGSSDDAVKRDLIVQYGTYARDNDGHIIGFKLPVGVNVDDIYPYTRWIKEVEENGRRFDCYCVYKHSAKMDTKEMSRLIDGAVYVARGYGIDTDTPEQKSRYERT